MLTTKQNNKMVNGIKLQANINRPLQTHKILTKEMAFNESS